MEQSPEVRALQERARKSRKKIENEILKDAEKKRGLKKLFGRIIL